jgi:hypothetical protein
MNLGAKLREQAEERKVRGEEQANYLAKVEERKREEERARIRSWFEEAKADALAAAEKGIEPNGIKVKGYGMPFIFGNAYRDRTECDPTSPLHPYHDVFVPYGEWARENGVTFEVTDEHDGVGMESWHRITVVPV